MDCETCGVTSTGRFCPGCGSVLQESPLNAESESAIPEVTDRARPLLDQATKATDAPGRSPWRRLAARTWVERSTAQRLAIGGVAAVALTGVVIGGTLGAVGASGAAAPGANAAASSRPMSHHEICVAQLLAATVNIGNGNSTTEMTVNGANDPFWVQGGLLASRATSDGFTVGTTEAVRNLRNSAESVCYDTLHDGIRPNYPTDGTSPAGDGPSTNNSDAGGSESACANGMTPVSDQQGNWVCP